MTKSIIKYLITFKLKLFAVIMYRGRSKMTAIFHIAFFKSISW